MSPKPVIKVDAKEALARAKAFDQKLLAEGSPIIRYVFDVVGKGYRTSVESGMGTFPNSAGQGSVTGNLEPFLGVPSSVTWDPLKAETMILKEEEDLVLELWMATRETYWAVDLHEEIVTDRYRMFAGIDGAEDPEAYKKAYATEFGGYSEPGGRWFDGRALFTILNAVFMENREKIMAKIAQEVAKTAQQVGWGRA